MLSGTVIFHGTSWPAAHVVERRSATFKLAAVPGMKAPQPEASLIIAVTGRPGWGWDAANRTSAIWRSLAEVSIDNEDQVLEFTRRHGDPTGVLSPAVAVDTADWLPAIMNLTGVARAWDEPGRDGLSRVTADRPRLQAAGRWTNFLLGALKDDVALIPEPDGGPALALQARTLSAYLTLSAAASLRQREAMRRCANCQFWFVPLRSDSRLCGPGCRTTPPQPAGS
jgi:hypothetical protein